jgi:hypothetical protein
VKGRIFLKKGKKPLIAKDAKDAKDGREGREGKLLTPFDFAQDKLRARRTVAEGAEKGF